MPSSTVLPPPPYNPGHIGPLPRHLSDVLRTWFNQNLDHPYPTEEEKAIMMDQTGLTVNQVSNWFINARRSTRHSRIEAYDLEEDDCSLQFPKRRMAEPAADMLDKGSQTSNDEVRLWDSESDDFPCVDVVDSDIDDLDGKPLSLTPDIDELNHSGSVTYCLPRTPSERDCLLPELEHQVTVASIENSQLKEQPEMPLPNIDDAPGLSYEYQAANEDALMAYGAHLRDLSGCGHRCIICEEQKLYCIHKNKEAKTEAETFNQSRSRSFNGRVLLGIGQIFLVVIWLLLIMGYFVRAASWPLRTFFEF